jgi:hypothetical protein
MHDSGSPYLTRAVSTSASLPAIEGNAPAPTSLASIGSSRAAELAHEINDPLACLMESLDEISRLSSAIHEALGGYRILVRRSGIPDANRAIGFIEAKIEAEGGLSALEELVGDALEGTHRILSIVRRLSTTR